MKQNRVHLNSVHQWVVTHDDRWLFVALYIGLAVVLSALISLFWLIVVVGVHFMFELIRQRHLLGDKGPAMAETLWELRLDAALILFAVAVALYMEFVIGVAGLRLAPRLFRTVHIGARGGTRIAAWSRVLRGVLMSVDDAAQLLRAAILRKKRAMPPETDAPQRPPDESSAYLNTVWGRWAAPWRSADIVIAVFFVLSALLIVSAPLLTDHSADDALRLILLELHPFPGR